MRSPTTTGACTTLTESIAYAHARSYTWDEVNARYLLAKLFHRKSLTSKRAKSSNVAASSPSPSAFA